jgi:hypothetical protein
VHVISSKVVVSCALALITAGGSALGVAQPVMRTESAAVVTAAQRAEVARRYDLAKRIVERVSANAGPEGVAPAERASLLVTLLTQPAERLAALSGAPERGALLSELAKPMPKLLGDASNDLVFKPFTPCRYIDTRNVGGKIAGIRTYDLANNGGVYGGSAACNPKTLALVANEDLIGALAVNIALVDTSSGAPGFLTMRPAGSTQLTALANWYVASASAQDSNAAVVAIDQTAQADEVEILTSGQVHVIVDLLGAFVAPQATALSCTTVQTNATNAAPGQFSQFNAFCPTGYTITGGGCHYYNTDGTPATENTVVINKSTRAYDPMAQTYLNGWLCALTNNDMAKTFNFGNRAVCCRVPGR